MGAACSGTHPCSDLDTRSYCGYHRSDCGIVDVGYDTHL